MEYNFHSPDARNTTELSEYIFSISRQLSMATDEDKALLQQAIKDGLLESDDLDEFKDLRYIKINDVIFILGTPLSSSTGYFATYADKECYDMDDWDNTNFIHTSSRHDDEYECILTDSLNCHDTCFYWRQRHTSNKKVN